MLLNNNLDAKKEFNLEKAYNRLIYLCTIFAQLILISKS